MVLQQVQKIRFNGLDFVLTDGHSNSPIVSVTDFKKGAIPYAHLCDDGKIMQLDRQIGTIKDITFGEFIKVEASKTVFAKGFRNWLVHTERFFL